MRRLMEAQGGVASTSQLKAAGVSRHAINDAVRRGTLVRVRRDAVILGSALRGTTPWERRVLVASAVGLSLARVPAAGPDLAGTAPDDDRRNLAERHALSHHSALAVHGLPYFGQDDLVHLCRTDGNRGRRDGVVWVHQPVDPEWVVTVDGIQVVSPALAALQVAALCGPEAGVVCLDGVLNAAEERDRELVGRRRGPAREEVDAQIARALGEGFASATQVVRKVVSFADGRSASAGESRSRWLIHLLGFGPCEVQFEVKDDADELLGVADLKLAAHNVLVEFDGRLKYTDRRDLMAEKWREDRIRDRGYQFVRLGWSDLERPQLVRRKLDAAILRAAVAERTG